MRELRVRLWVTWAWAILQYMQTKSVNCSHSNYSDCLEFKPCECLYIVGQWIGSGCTLFGEWSMQLWPNENTSHPFFLCGLISLVLLPGYGTGPSVPGQTNQCIRNSIMTSLHTREDLNTMWISPSCSPPPYESHHVPQSCLLHNLCSINFCFKECDTINVSLTSVFLFFIC